LEVVHVLYHALHVNLHMKKLIFPNMLSVWWSYYQQWEGGRRTDEGMNVKPMLLLRVPLWSMLYCSVSIVL